MAFPQPKPPGDNPSGNAPGNPVQPAPGQASKLAAKLAGKAGVKSAATPPPLIPRPGSKGGRLSVAEESAAYLAKSGLVAVPVASAGNPGDANLQPVPHVVTPEFVGEMTANILKGIESFDVQRMTQRARVLCGDATLAKEFGQSFAAPAGCIDTIAKSMMEVARKYPGILQWTPELAIAGAGSAWFFKRNEGAKSMGDMEARINKQLEKMSATPVRTATPSAPTPDNAKP